MDRSFVLPQATLLQGSISALVTGVFPNLIVHPVNVKLQHVFNFRLVRTQLASELVHLPDVS